MTARSRTAAVVVNPLVAKEAGELLRAALTARGIETTWIETTEDDPGVGQVRRAVEDGADIVLACGGDGTVRACIEGMHGTGATLVVVPAGTGNLLALNLELPEDPAESVAVMEGGATQRIDVGWLNDEAFAVMAGAGFDAALMRDTSSEAKRWFGRLAYVVAGLRHLRDERRFVRVEIDGESVFAGLASTLLVANMGNIGDDLQLFSEADPTDGRLEVMIVTAEGLRDWVLAAFEALGRRPAGRRVRRWRGAAIVASYRHPVPYELDGDDRPPTDSLVFRVEPSSLDVCVGEAQRTR